MLELTSMEKDKMLLFVNFKNIFFDYVTSFDCNYRDYYLKTNLTKSNKNSNSVIIPHQEDTNSIHSVNFATDIAFTDKYAFELVGNLPVNHIRSIISLPHFYINLKINQKDTKKDFLLNMENLTMVLLRDLSHEDSYKNLLNLDLSHKDILHENSFLTKLGFKEFLTFNHFYCKFKEFYNAYNSNFEVFCNSINVKSTKDLLLSALTVIDDLNLLSKTLLIKKNEASEALERIMGIVNSRSDINNSEKNKAEKDRELKRQGKGLNSFTIDNCLFGNNKENNSARLTEEVQSKMLADLLRKEKYDLAYNNIFMNALIMVYNIKIVLLNGKDFCFLKAKEKTRRKKSVHPHFNIPNSTESEGDPNFNILDKPVTINANKTMIDIPLFNTINPESFSHSIPSFTPKDKANSKANVNTIIDDVLVVKLNNKNKSYSEVNSINIEKELVNKKNRSKNELEKKDIEKGEALYNPFIKKTTKDNTKTNNQTSRPSTILILKDYFNQPLIEEEPESSNHPSKYNHSNSINSKNNTFEELKPHSQQLVNRAKYEKRDESKYIEININNSVSKLSFYDIKDYNFFSVLFEIRTCNITDHVSESFDYILEQQKSKLVKLEMLVNREEREFSMNLRLSNLKLNLDLLTINFLNDFLLVKEEIGKQRVYESIEKNIQERNEENTKEAKSKNNEENKNPEDTDVCYFQEDDIPSNLEKESEIKGKEQELGLTEYTEYDYIEVLDKKTSRGIQMKKNSKDSKEQCFEGNDVDSGVRLISYEDISQEPSKPNIQGKNIEAFNNFEYIDMTQSIQLEPIDNNKQESLYKIPNWFTLGRKASLTKEIIKVTKFTISEFKLNLSFHQPDDYNSSNKLYSFKDVRILIKSFNSDLCLAKEKEKEVNTVVNNSLSDNKAISKSTVLPSANNIDPKISSFKSNIISKSTTPVKESEAVPEQNGTKEEERQDIQNKSNESNNPSPQLSLDKVVKELYTNWKDDLLNNQLLEAYFSTFQLIKPFSKVLSQGVKLFFKPNLSEEENNRYLHIFKSFVVPMFKSLVFAKKKNKRKQTSQKKAYFNELSALKSVKMLSCDVKIDEENVCLCKECLAYTVTK